MSYSEVQPYSLAASAAVLAQQDLLASTPFERAFARIAQLESLKPGWNGHRAGPPSPRALFNARRVTQFLPPASVADMAVIPTNRGGVQLEWHGNGVDVEIEIARDGAVTCVVDDEAELLDAEGPLSSHWVTIHQALRRVG